MPNFLRLAAIGAAAAAALPVSAALPPSYQRLAELRAVLADPAVAAAFDMEAPIERVELVRRDLYRVSAGRCHLDVAIADLPSPPDVAGPRRFETVPGRRVCARESEAR